MTLVNGDPLFLKRKHDQALPPLELWYYLFDVCLGDGYDEMVRISVESVKMIR